MQEVRLPQPYHAVRPCPRRKLFLASVAGVHRSRTVLLSSLRGASGTISKFSGD